MEHMQKYDAYVGGWVFGGGCWEMKPPLPRELQRFCLFFILYGNAHKVIEVPGVKVEDLDEPGIFRRVNRGRALARGIDSEMEVAACRHYYITI